MKRTKIVATLGPASSSDENLMALLRAGVDVFRVNFSHGDPEDHRKLIQRIRKLLDENQWTAAILADLQGPKLRIGVVEEGAEVHPGDTITFTNHPCEGTSQRVYMTYQDFPKDVKPGDRILLDDGKLLMTVLSTNGVDEVVAKVVQGGPLKSKKGVNLPNTRVSLPCLTDKDLVDLRVALEEDVEWIGLSFVRSAEDIKVLRTLLKQSNSHAGIVAKIEKPEAVADIDRILAATDAVMVARGDLGVEIPAESVPLVQKMLTRKAMLLSKPVIVATQMMETMIESLTPTRAEVNDVANAVLDGADAVMLSGETSVGKYPIEVVETMARIIRHAEASKWVKAPKNPPKKESSRFLTDTICYQAAKMADALEAKAIVTMTFSGYTAERIASHRPASSVFVFTSNRRILNKLNLFWGVRCFFYDKMVSTDDTFSDVKAILKANQCVFPGNTLITIASMPIEARGTTNMLKVSVVD